MIKQPLNIISPDPPDLELNLAINAATANPGDRSEYKQDKLERTSSSASDEEHQPRDQTGEENEEQSDEQTEGEGTDTVTNTGTQEEPESHWVGIKLEDDEGNPVPNQPYEVHTPDGKIIRGRLDEKGEAKMKDIEKSQNLDITFPEIHGNEWKDA